MPALVAFPCETAVSIASLMMGGMLTRHPRLRIAFGILLVAIGGYYLRTQLSAM